jgi:hypothetical protein
MDPSILDLFSDFHRKLQGDILAAVEKSLVDKAYRLTDSEQFAVAYFSGSVKIDWKCVSPGKIVGTTEDCNIVWDGERFMVATKGKETI